MFAEFQIHDRIFPRLPKFYGGRSRHDNMWWLYIILSDSLQSLSVLWTWGSSKRWALTCLSAPQDFLDFTTLNGPDITFTGESSDVWKNSVCCLSLIRRQNQFLVNQSQKQAPFGLDHQNGTLPLIRCLARDFACSESPQSLKGCRSMGPVNDTPDTPQQPAHHGQDAVSSLPLQPAKLEVEIKRSWCQFKSNVSNVDSGFRSLSCHHLGTNKAHQFHSILYHTLSIFIQIGLRLHDFSRFGQRARCKLWHLAFKCWSHPSSFHEFSIVFQVFDEADRHLNPGKVIHHIVWFHSQALA